jgi:MFS family permease
MGNVLEYYDFLLFAHIGLFIVPHFIPKASQGLSHHIALLLFALPFFIRPLGGYLIGILADRHSTHKALNQTLCYAAMASGLIAILPTYNQIGLSASLLFVCLRGLQGFALGGEYTTAGSALMAEAESRPCLISSVLAASGCLGSLVALGFSLLYITQGQGTGLWRFFFLLGAIASYTNYRLRQRHLSAVPDLQPPTLSKQRLKPHYARAAILTGVLGAIVSVSCFIPMVYSYFYLTHVRQASPTMGLMVTGLSLLSYLLFTPLVGYFSDRFTCTARGSALLFLLSIPVSCLGFVWILSGNLVGQVLLTLAASLAGANVHVLMHGLFKRSHQRQSINLYFSAGTSLGGLTPALSAYAATYYAYTPLVIISALLFIGAYLLGTHQR